MMDGLTRIAGVVLILATGPAWAAMSPFVCMGNGTCVYQCRNDNDCVKAGCSLGHCDTHTPDGQLCLNDPAFQKCLTAADCPQGKVCNGALCEDACSP
jgi:hypothetical protein